MTSASGGDFDRLARELLAVFAEGVAAPWSGARFDELAHRVFVHQFEANPVYRRFCRGRGVTPGSVGSWDEIPTVPTAAFKEVEVAPGPVEAVFETSGTTRGRGARGRHGVRSLALYRAACLPNLAAHLLPDGRALPILSLIPPATASPASSLARMLAFAVEAMGAEGSRSFADGDGGIDIDAFARALGRYESGNRPVWVAGTAFAFVHWIEAVERGRADPVTLPPGSRVMETGGFKGRSREVGKDELYGGIETTLGVPPSWVVNEYGMTELLSQFYDGIAGEPGRAPPAKRSHRPPPWMRTRVLDPTTLSAVEPGIPGVLAHFDLANLGSVSAVLTEDRGVADGRGGFRLLGRRPGSEPRGCSLTLEELLEAQP